MQNAPQKNSPQNYSHAELFLRFRSSLTPVVLVFLPTTNRSERRLVPVALLIASFSLSGCGSKPDDAEGKGKSDTSAKSPFTFDGDDSKTTFTPKGNASNNDSVAQETVKLVDVAKSWGLEFTHRNFEDGRAIMVEATGGGGGWGDFDRDGNWDLYLNQGADYERPFDNKQPNDALFLNVGGQFVDVTGPARIEDFNYGQGVTVGDYDNDGFDDIYVANYGKNTLWHNMGDGTFEAVTDAAGVQDLRWSSTAGWGDIDQDGDLDLYLNNYVKYNVIGGECRNDQGQARICHPRDFEPAADECFINQGDGTFKAEAKQRGIFGPGNKGLGIAIADFTNDGLPDMYVANDTEGNFLFVNQGNGIFQEQGDLLGCATSRNGQNQASMGLAIADLDFNGWLDIYITHYENESNTFYQSIGEAGYEDNTAKVGLHYPTMPVLGFGVAPADLNSNGRYELVIGNGHVQNFPNNPNHKMKSQVMAVNEAGYWREITKTCGEYFSVKRVVRGLARCDFDNDGDVDFAMIHQNDPVSLLRNDSESGHYLKLQFVGYESNRRGIGCRVVLRYDGKKRMQELIGGGSFAVGEQPMLHFGTGEFDGPCELEVLWPSGKRQTLQVSLDQELLLHEPAN